VYGYIKTQSPDTVLLIFWIKKFYVFTCDVLDFCVNYGIAILIFVNIVDVAPFFYQTFAVNQ